MSKRTKKAGGAADGDDSDALPFKYDPRTMQKVLRVRHMVGNAGAAWTCAAGMVDALVDGVGTHLQEQKLKEMYVPYITEAGLALALEPSLIYHFEHDGCAFYIDTELERQEPPCPALDQHCNDRKAGQENLAKRAKLDPDLLGLDGECASAGGESAGSARRHRKRPSLQPSVMSANSFGPSPYR